MGRRVKVQCADCRSLERTRVFKLFLDRADLPKAGMSVLHMAPERSLYEFLSGCDLALYDVVDIAPENFRFAEVRKLDLCKDAAGLRSGEYDLIIHSHVMEHVPCNVTAVMYHLHRSLKPGGLHLMCLPFLDGAYEEDLAEIGPDAALKRFGQNDHVRRFGKADVQMTLGMVFRIPERYSLADYFGEDTLDACNIPPREREGFTGTSVFPLGKEDLLLAD
jgi:phosphoglycolate phosphatase